VQGGGGVWERGHPHSILTVLFFAYT